MQTTPQISVIVPMYKSQKYHEQLINTLVGQSLDKNLFEVLFVINGEDEKSKVMFEQELDPGTALDARVHYIEEANVSKARNYGIDNARGKYVTFLDADDLLSPNYLESLYEHRNDGNIIITNIKDKNINGSPKKTVLSEMYEASNNRTLRADETLKIHGLISNNANKLIEKEYIGSLRYQEHLKSGEDIVFFMDILSSHKPIVYLIPSSEDSYYIRTLTDNSVSRKALSYSFNVEQRKEVIKQLIDIKLNEDGYELRNIITTRINAQAQFIERYLIKNPEKHPEVLKTFSDLDHYHLPYHIINKGMARELVLSYCFSPYVDTSGVVMAKRIIEQDKVVDVISNDMSNVRNIDFSLNLLSQKYVENRYKYSGTPSFSNYELINDYVQYGLSIYKHHKNKYESIYSRALWPGSHFLGYEIKLKNTKLYWKAEFSDPILYDINNNERNSSIPAKKYNEILDSVPGRYRGMLNNNLYDLCEILPFIFADELIFTNDHQMKQMIDRFDDDFQDVIIGKARIAAHPTLPESYYDYRRSDLKLEPGFNIGYFGNFYSTRSVEDIINLVRKMGNDEIEKKVNLYVFTNLEALDTSEFDKEYGNVTLIFQPYEPFLKFLNVCNKFDLLLLFDANTKGIKSLNPYLPSKLSDYLGSNAHILAIEEAGSPMSKINHEKLFHSNLGDVDHQLNIIKKFVFQDGM